MIDPYSLLGPLLRSLPPEMSHRAAIGALRVFPPGTLSRGMLSRARPAVDDRRLAIDLWGLAFANPVGLAAGFDKSAEVFDRLAGWGFGFVEIGSVTPLPQRGNQRPRLFRLREDRALINRMGFNNDGLERIARRLADGRRNGFPLIVGANLGKSRDSPDAQADYVLGVQRLAPLVDYLAVNVSSPNTENLRALQAREPLSQLIEAVVEARRAAKARAPILVKLAPDLGNAEVEAIAEVVSQGKIDGLIISNTTIARPRSLRSRHRDQAGGLSGPPLFAPSTMLIGDFYRLTAGRLPIIGVGGIESGDDAYAKIRAGASLIELYTALVYQGPGLIARLKRDLLARLERDGFGRLSEAVGADHR